MEIILIGILAGTFSYIVSSTGAVEAYYKLFLKIFRMKSSLYENPGTARLDFWMKMGLKYPNSFLVSLFSCGVCLSTFSALVLSVFLFKFNLLLFSSSFFAILSYCTLDITVKEANKR